MQKQFAAILVVLLSLLALSVAIVAANPLPAPLVSVQSPQNNQVFTSDRVPLIFTPIAENCTSFSYVLDNQSPVATDGNTTLTNLSAGSHSITIYANRTLAALGFVVEGKEVAYVIYFSVVYSTASVTVAVSALPTALIISLLLFFRRRQIDARLRGKKASAFWLGAILFTLAALVFILSSWQVANDYLFPHWPKGLSDYLFPYWLTTAMCIAFMGLGFGLMWRGTRKSPVSA